MTTEPTSKPTSKRTPMRARAARAMATLAALLALALAAPSLDLLAAEGDGYRTFTDRKGREIRAKIVAVSGKNVTIKREKDGREFSVRQSTFSQSDRDHIREWASKNVFAQKGALEVSTKTVRGKSTKVDLTGWDGKRQPVGYEIEIKNRSGVPLTDIEVRFQIFKKEVRKYDGTQDVRTKETIQRSPGLVKVPIIQDGSYYTFETPKVLLTNMEVASGYVGQKGQEEVEDELEGIWLRIYKDGDVAFEYSQPDSLKRKVVWHIDPPAGAATAPPPNPNPNPQPQPRPQPEID